MSGGFDFMLSCIVRANGIVAVRTIACFPSSVTVGLRNDVRQRNGATVPLMAVSAKEV